ncbi:unnamed protein product [Miscanthus lutarioriparius]|uniref:Bifunctional inhibitor/plant lipid transfer protein/seed storage helical domain-containing protein n=1 Tax=Miscanthus lutarioriparius TaxID=422564 RepID=A0A811SMY4_9POAL|nr:unnamed protein product [Miscanthus lutarioriparius]
MASRGLLTTVVALLLLQHQPLATAGGEAGAAEELQYRRHRRFHHHRETPQTPTAPVQPVQPVQPPPPPPPRRCNRTFGPEEALTVGGDDCVPVPAPPVPPPRGRCPPCTCPAPKQPQPQPPRPFPGWPVPRPLPVPGRGGSDARADSGTNIDCVAPLAPLTACGEFVTGNQTDTPMPTSACCSALAAFLRTSSAAAAAGRGDHMLRCLCPVIHGDMNKVLRKPIDPVRMLYLPIACGVVLPPQLLYICFAGQGQPTPAVDSQP